MTELNTSNLQQTVNNVLQESLNTKLKKNSILLWTNHGSKYPNSFILKKEGRKYLGLPRTDKKGETYWAFREVGVKRNQSMEQTKENARTNNSEQSASS
jgi:hypothetical protein